MPRHVRDLRLAVVPEPAEGELVLSGLDDDDDDDSAPISIREQTRISPEKVARGETGETLFDSEEGASLRRSSREHRSSQGRLATLTQIVICKSGRSVFELSGIVVLSDVGRVSGAAARVYYSQMCDCSVCGRSSLRRRVSVAM